MSLTHQKWDEVLDGAQAFEGPERERLRRALDLAQWLFEQFPHPIDRVDATVSEYSKPDRRLPLMVQAPFETEEEYADLRWELAQKVLGPVFKATRISMPVVSLTAQSPMETPPGPGTLYLNPSFTP